ncbi:MAG: hypothetical protein AAF492_13870, partial [Verrucomicrobiota bacterium]
CAIAATERPKGEEGTGKSKEAVAETNKRLNKCYKLGAHVASLLEISTFSQPHSNPDLIEKVGQRLRKAQHLSDTLSLEVSLTELYDEKTHGDPFEGLISGAMSRMKERLLQRHGETEVSVFSLGYLTHWTYAELAAKYSTSTPEAVSDKISTDREFGEIIDLLEKLNLVPDRRALPEQVDIQGKIRFLRLLKTDLDERWRSR